MPGLVGCVGAVEDRAVDAALAKLCALPRSAAERHAITDGVTLAAVTRGNPSAPPSTSFARDDDAAVLVFGAMFREHPAPHRVTAADLLADARAERLVDALADCDGGYCVAALDLRRRRLTVLADRVGSQPVLYATSNRGFAFAPEAKAVLALTGTEARYSRRGVLQFLALGYCLGTDTLLEGVSYLEPGTVLTYDLDTRAVRVARYWSMRFAPDRALDRRGAAEEALHDAILRSHRVLLADRPARHQILLSGGIDSRGMLAALMEIDAPPAQALAWGLTRTVRWSDAFIAERLAADYGVPFRFMPYDTDTFVENASEWAYVSEIANDNVGWFAEGVPALRDFYSASDGVSFIGDEVWGYGGRVSGEPAIRATTLPARLPSPLRRILSSAAARDADAKYEGSIQDVMRPCTATASGDRREFLYVHARTARLLMSLGYYKEHATELRRPYLTRIVLDVVARLPDRLRLHKNLFRSMLTRFYPAVMRYPGNVASSLPRWSADVRSKAHLRSAFLGLLQAPNLERIGVADMLDVGAFEALRDGFFAAPVPDAPRRGVERRAAMSRTFNGSRALQRATALAYTLRASTATPDETSEFDVLGRLAALVLLERRFVDLSRR